VISVKWIILRKKTQPTNQSDMKSKETLARLTALAEKHLDTTRDDRPCQIIWSGEGNAGDSGYHMDDADYHHFVILSMRELLSDRDHADTAAWFASHGFIA
jgi:hypothetical protein